MMAAISCKAFREGTYRLTAEPKVFFIVSYAGHIDLRDEIDLILFDKQVHFLKSFEIKLTYYFNSRKAAI